MQFQVPQFLDVEDKVIGPLTIKQFLFLAGGVGGGYIVIRIIPWLIVGLLPALAVVLLGAALAFYRYNNKPFTYFIEAGFNYFLHSRLYVWKRAPRPVIEEKELQLPTSVQSAFSIPSTGTSKLSSLTWQIDTHGEEVTTQRVTPKN